MEHCWYGELLDMGVLELIHILERKMLRNKPLHLWGLVKLWVNDPRDAEPRYMNSKLR